eukprot:1348744-Amorphochlora_amoeboformis.AAC.2
MGGVCVKTSFLRGNYQGELLEGGMEDREGSQSMVIFDSIAERKRKKSERERKKNRGKIYWGKAVRDIYFHWRPSHE